MSCFQLKRCKVIAAKSRYSERATTHYVLEGVLNSVDEYLNLHLLETVELIGGETRSLARSSCADTVLISPVESLRMSAEEALDYIKSRPHEYLQRSMEGFEDRFSQMLSRISGQASRMISSTARWKRRSYRDPALLRNPTADIGSLLALDGFEPCAGCIVGVRSRALCQAQRVDLSIVMGIEPEDARKMSNEEDVGKTVRRQKRPFHAPS